MSSALERSSPSRSTGSTGDDGARSSASTRRLQGCFRVGGEQGPRLREPLIAPRHGGLLRGRSRVPAAAAACSAERRAFVAATACSCARPVQIVRPPSGHPLDSAASAPPGPARPRGAPPPAPPGIPFCVRARGLRPLPRLLRGRGLPERVLLRPRGPGGRLPPVSAPPGRSPPARRRSARRPGPRRAPAHCAAPRAPRRPVLPQPPGRRGRARGSAPGAAADASRPHAHDDGPPGLVRRRRVMTSAASTSWKIWWRPTHPAQDPAFRQRVEQRRQRGDRPAAYSAKSSGA